MVLDELDRSCEADVAEQVGGAVAEAVEEGEDACLEGGDAVGGGEGSVGQERGRRKGKGQSWGARAARTRAQTPALAQRLDRL